MLSNLTVQKDIVVATFDFQILWNNEEPTWELWATNPLPLELNILIIVEQASDILCNWTVHMLQYITQSWTTTGHVTES